MADAREAHLCKVLEEIAKQRNYENPDFKIKGLPPTGANFSSQLFHSTITAPGRDELNLFAKVAAIGEKFRAQANVNAFDIERHFYIKLAKTYADIEDKHNVSEQHRLVVPKYYGCSDTYLEEVIVLQDLSRDGYISYDRFKSVDWSYASKAIEELAKFHALSIAYQKEYREEYEAATKVLKRSMPEQSSEMVGMMQQMMLRLMEAVRVENRYSLLQFVKKGFDPETFNKFYQPHRLPVIVHSDFRQSNLMHKLHETAHPGRAAIDLLYFIFTGSDAQFRRQHYDELIEHYYAHMAAALRRLDLDPDVDFPREDFEQDLKDMLPFGLMVSVFLLPMITLDAAHVPESEQSISMESMGEMLSNINELCGRRLNEVVDDYVAWGLL